MIAYARNPLVQTWLFLVFATIAGWLLGSHHERGMFAAFCVLALAMIKVRLVIWNYMEVGRAPSWLRRACDSWLLLNTAMVAAFHWLNG